MYGGDGGWYSLLERVASRSMPMRDAFLLATRARQDHVDGRWAMPLAMAHWLDDRYSDALAILLEPSVAKDCDALWMYHNLVGMVARKIEGEVGRAAQAYERSLELDPNRADTLYNYANLLKDDEPERAVPLYRRSLVLEPSAASGWHNYGTALNSLTKFQDALFALRLSLRLIPLLPTSGAILVLPISGSRNLLALRGHFVMP